MYVYYLEDVGTDDGVRLRDGTFLDVREVDDSCFLITYDEDSLKACAIPNFCGGVLLTEVDYNSRLIEATLDYLWNEGYTLVSYISNHKITTERFKSLGFVVTHVCVNRRTDNTCSYLVLDISERKNIHLDNYDPYAEDEENDEDF